MDIELRDNKQVSSSSPSVADTEKSHLSATTRFGALLFGFIACIAIIGVTLSAYYGTKWQQCEKDNDSSTEVSPVEWIRANAYNITAVETKSSDDFADLTFMSTYTNDVEVLWIGETNHGDGSIHQLRTRIIKYLHQCCGFNTITFEVPFYDGYYGMAEVAKLSAAEKTPAKVREIFQKYVSLPYWGSVNETQELFQYIADQTNTQNPLEFTGYDCQPDLSGSVFTDLTSFLQSSLPTDKVPSPAFFEILKNVLGFKYWPFWPEVTSLPSKSDIDMYFETILSTNSLLLSLPPSQDNPYKQFYKTWTQIFNNSYSIGLEAMVDGPPCGWQFSGCSSPDFALNNRQYQMAQNALWHLKSTESFVGITKRKMIVWTANYHASKDINSWLDSTYQISYCHDKVAPCEVVPAMDIVKASLGSKSYSLGTTAFSGEIGSNSCPPASDGGGSIFSPVGSLEYYFNQAGFTTAAFLDFTKNSIPTWLSSGTTVAFHEYVVNKGNVANIFDAVLYLHRMNPITCF